MKFLPSIQKSFVDVAGIPLDGGKILVLKSGSTDHADLYADAEGTSFAKNPYTLDVSGSFKFFVDADMDLDYFVYDEGGALAYSYYNIKVNSCDCEGGGGGPSGDVEWDDVKNKPSAFPPSAHRHNASEIDNLPEVPTKTSQLENDSGFITSEDIPAVPTKTSELENDSGFLTSVAGEWEPCDYEIVSGYTFSGGFTLNINITTGLLLGKFDFGTSSAITEYATIIRIPRTAMGLVSAYEAFGISRTSSAIELSQGMIKLRFTQDDNYINISLAKLATTQALHGFIGLCSIPIKPIK